MCPFLSFIQIPNHQQSFSIYLWKYLKNPKADQNTGRRRLLQTQETHQEEQHFPGLCGAKIRIKSATSASMTSKKSNSKEGK